MKFGDEWRTPKAIFDRYDKLYHFDIDVAATKENALCKRYFTMEDDALKQSWDGMTCWCNPPYSNIEAWVEKAYGQRLRGTTTVMLLPAWTDRKWFHRWVYYIARVEFLPGRVRHMAPDGSSIGVNPMWGSMIVIYDNRYDPII